MKSAIIATIIGSAAAFAPAPVAKTTTAVNAFEGKFHCIALMYIYIGIRSVNDNTLLNFILTCLLLLSTT